MVKQPVNIRLDKDLLKKFDALPGTRTENLEKAMQLYIQRVEGVDTGKDIGKDFVDTNVEQELYNSLKMQISSLEADKMYLQTRLTEAERAGDELRRSLAFEQQAHKEALQLALPPSIPEVAKKVKRHWWQRRR